MRAAIASIRSLLFVHKYLHFFITGVTGVALNLATTWFFTRFVFGLERYFTAYLIGIAVNLIYNFLIHTIVTFQTKSRHLLRFGGFIAYSLVMTTFQAWLVRTITPIFGLHYYLVVIAGVILIFSVVSFIFFKFFLFREQKTQEAQTIRP